MAALSPALETSPFGRLSIELRLMIWEYTLQEEECISLNHIATNDTEPTKKDESDQSASHNSTSDGVELNAYILDDLPPEKQPSILSLTETCKQVRYETMPIFLESNSFHAACPIFDNSKGHGEISSDATQHHRQRLQTWIQTLENNDETWPSRIRNLTIDLGIWRICGCKSSSEAFVDALSEFSASFPRKSRRMLKVRFQVQWRAICPCCESDTNDESVWPLEFELERGRNDKFFEAVMEVCEGRAKWILGREGLCGRTRMAWLLQLERASGRLVEVFGWLGRAGREWGKIEGGEGRDDGEEMHGTIGSEEVNEMSEEPRY